MKITKNIGMLLLAIYLIIVGIIYFVPQIAFNGIEAIRAGLAIAAGVCILIGK